MNREYVVGKKILIPTFEEIQEYFGIKADGTPDLKIRFDAAGAMRDMCGKAYTIYDISNTAIRIEDPDSGYTFDFQIEIFNIDTKNNKNYIGITKKININDILIKQIEHRYELVNRDYLDEEVYNYGIFDTVYPYEKIEAIKRERKVSTFDYRQSAISEKIAKEFNVKHLKIDELITILGYSKKDIDLILSRLKDKQHDICIIGYGGTGTNFLHWLSQLALLTEKRNIFNQLILQDNDFFDTTNLFRIPFILPELNTGKLLNKIYYFKDYAKVFSYSYLNENTLNKTNMEKNFIYYGAPDLETRKDFKEMEIPFVAATHRNEDCGLTLNPEIDTELMVETYGKISLTTFFLNHLKMTIEFLNFLSDVDNINKLKNKKENKILQYNFARDAMGNRHNQDFTINENQMVIPVLAEKHNIVIR